MKKLLITTVALCFLTLGTYAQSNEVMVIKSADGGAGDPSYRLSCSITDSFLKLDVHM